MVDAIEADFRGDGRVVNVVVSRRDEAAPIPRLVLQVLGSDSGDASMRNAARVSGITPITALAGTALAIVGSGTMVVDTFIVRAPDMLPIYLGRVKTSSLGANDAESVAAGERAGHAIAGRALK